MNISYLQSLGLTEKEILIYMTLLKFGPSVASTLAKRTGLKRVTAYAVLRSLQRQAFVDAFSKNDVAYFQAQDPEVFLKIEEKNIEQAKQRRMLFRQWIPQLRKFAQKDSGSAFRFHDRITYYEGTRGIQQLLDDVLREGKKEQLCFGINRLHIENPDSEWPKYTMRRVSIGMNVRSIVPDSPEAREYKKRDATELRETRLVPQEKFRATCELNIIGNKVIIIDVNPTEKLGAIIESKEIAETLKNLFELAWERAKEYQK